MNNTKQESKKIYEDAEATKLYQSNEKVDTFKNEMNDRLPGPLSILLTIIPASRSRLVRKSGLALCHVILIDSMFIWDSSNMNTLERKAFEYCLTVLGDADGKKTLATPYRVKDSGEMLQYILLLSIFS